MALAKLPFWGAIVIVSVPCPPLLTVMLFAAAASEKSGDVPVIMVTVADANLVVSATLVAVILIGFPAVEDGAVYVAEVDEVWVRIP
jgi:hypothetical protein